jgi:hypothetical protein
VGDVELNYLYLQEIHPRGRFLVNMELSAILDAQLFHSFLSEIVERKSHEKRAQLVMELCGL